MGRGSHPRERVARAGLAFLTRTGRACAAAVLAVLCAPAAAAAAEAELAPVVEHRPVPQATRGEPLRVRAKVTTMTGAAVFAPSVFIRARGMETFSPVAMKPEKGVPDVWAPELPAVAL